MTPQFSKPQKCVAGAAEAGLHFVGDAQAAVLADDVVDDLEIFRRRRDGAADALDRFADEAGDLAGAFRTGSRSRRRGHTSASQTGIFQTVRAAVAVAGDARVSR